MSSEYFTDFLRVWVPKLAPFISARDKGEKIPIEEFLREFLSGEQHILNINLLDESDRVQVSYELFPEGKEYFLLIGGVSMPTEMYNILAEKKGDIENKKLREYYETRTIRPTAMFPESFSSNRKISALGTTFPAIFPKCRTPGKKECAHFYGFDGDKTPICPYDILYMKNVLGGEEAKESCDHGRNYYLPLDFDGKKYVTVCSVKSCSSINFDVLRIGDDVVWSASYAIVDHVDFNPEKSSPENMRVACEFTDEECQHFKEMRCSYIHE